LHRILILRWSYTIRLPQNTHEHPGSCAAGLVAKEENITLLSTFQEKKTACENIYLASFITGTLELNNESSPKICTNQRISHLEGTDHAPEYVKHLACET